MSISSKFKKGLYTSLIVAAGLLGAQEVRGQQLSKNILAPLKNINLFVSQDETEQAKIYNNAKTYEERDSITEARIAEDWTNTGPFANCNEFVLQSLVNSHNWKKDTYTGARLIYNGYDGLDPELINENNGTIADMGKLGLPINQITTYDPVTLKQAHSQIYIVLGDTLTYENINIIEPSNDATHIQPGDGRSPLPKTIEEIELFYDYTYTDDKGKENYRSMKVLGYKSEDGKITETYNINNDTRILYPWIAEKPLNQLVHLQMSRNEKPTGIKEIKLENIAELYPNPTSDYIRINIPNNNNTIDAKIYSINGIMVQENIIENREEINIQQLQKGIFLVRISDGNTVYIGKFAKR